MGRISVARVAVGLLFFLPDGPKLFVPERREQMRQTLIKAHVPFPEFNAAFVSTVEFVCGLLLVLGAGDATGVCVARGRNYCRHCDDSDSEYQSNLANRVARGISVICLGALPGDSYWLFFSGPGWLSIDHLFLSRIHL